MSHVAREKIKLRNRLKRLRGQIDGVPPRETAAASAHRSSYGVDDHSVRHSEPL